jgi:hypothetical protein
VRQAHIYFDTHTPTLAFLNPSCIVVGMGEILEHDLPDEESNQSEGFKVTDDFKADWALRKFRAFQQRIHLNEELAEKEIKRIKEWLQQENLKVVQKQEFFEAHLLDYAIRERNEHDRKTISLPNGKVSTRVTNDLPIVEDKAEFIKWSQANNHEEHLKNEIKIDLAELKKHVSVQGEKVIWEDTGEIVQGVSVKEGKLSLKIETE